ncbi:MAG: hypothetical protein JNM39_04830 [Bdellovibrionaceae bacterium]|nr:hypothetical protein [Pseudobdellovibrionaceae bacterium]
MESSNFPSVQIENERPTRKAVTVIFEFSVLKPKFTVFRGVQATDGGFRMEKRGLNAKKFKPFMWCGSRESLYKYQEVAQKTSVR